MDTEQPPSQPSAQPETIKLPESLKDFDPENLPPMPSVETDIICLDDHSFRIGPGVPEEVIERFYALFDAEEDIKYEDIPKDLLQYEIENEDERDHVVIDGHKFRVNYGVPDDVTAAILELADKEDVKYSDVPKHLLEYEDIPAVFSEEVKKKFKMQD